MWVFRPRWQTKDGHKIVRVVRFSLSCIVRLSWLLSLLMIFFPFFLFT